MKNSIFSIILLLIVFCHLKAEGLYLTEAASLADQRLAEIAAQQESIFNNLAANTDIPTPDQERCLYELVQAYESFLSDNPDSVYGTILYGKCLRRLGNDQKAAHLFMQANKLDPNISVVKQQLGNYLAEKGDYLLALPYFLSAIELKPEEPIYHYQLAELLFHYKPHLLQDHIFEPKELDDKILHALREAARLAPEARSFAFRLAEAFYDLSEPDWVQALAQWDKLYQTSASEAEKEIILFQRARVLIELGRFNEAHQALNRIFSPALEQNRRELLARLPQEKSCP